MGGSHILRAVDHIRYLIYFYNSFGIMFDDSLKYLRVKDQNGVLKGIFKTKKVVDDVESKGYVS